MKHLISAGVWAAPCLHLLILLSTVSLSATPPPIPEEQRLYLKDYESHASVFRAGFIPYKAQIVQGEPLQVTFVIENVGSNVVKFTFGGDYRGTGRHDRFKITATDADGSALPDPLKTIYDFGGFIQLESLKPGQGFTNIIDLTKFRVIDKPGTYKVSCSFGLKESFQQNEKPEEHTVSAQFPLEILERTPVRVAGILDELVAKARIAPPASLDETLSLLARFGQEEAVPRLARLAGNEGAGLRTAAVGALSLIPTQASLEVLLVKLRDPDPAIRMAAAGSLGALRMPGGVQALLGALPGETSPVAEAILQALGTSQSEQAFPTLLHALDTGTLKQQQAAINALVAFGGSNAVAALSQRLNPGFVSLRYEIVLALAEKLHQPLQAESLAPVLAGREQSHKWLDSLRLLRLYAGDQAVPALLSYLDFDVAWSGRNWWILNAVRACRNAPRADYEHDYNTDGTPGQWTKNLQTLQALRPLTNPVPPLLPKSSPAPDFKPDPSIDFTPVFRDAGDHVEIKSGFLCLNLARSYSSEPVSVPEIYQATYKEAALLRALPNNPDRIRKLDLSPGQVTQITDLLHRFAEKLHGSAAADQDLSNLYTLLTCQPDYCPGGGRWTSLYFAYREAPAGTLKEQARINLMDSVRDFSQAYHTGTLEFVESGRKVLSTSQLKQL